MSDLSCVDLETGKCLGDCQGCGTCPLCEEFWGVRESFTSEDMIEWGKDVIKSKQEFDEFLASDEGKKFTEEMRVVMNDYIKKRKLNFGVKENGTSD